MELARPELAFIFYCEMSSRHTAGHTYTCGLFFPRSSDSCLLYKLSQSGETSPGVLFCPQPKDVKFTVIEEERDRELVTWKKLKSNHFDFYFLIKLLKLMNSRRLIK